MKIIRYWFLICYSFVNEGSALSKNPEKYCDYVGPPIKSSKVSSPQSCLDECLLNKSCQSFTFISGWNRCFLKGTPSRKVNVIMISGNKSSMPISDRDHSGKDLKKIEHIPSAKQCQEKCNDHDKCKAFTYIQGYSSCWLKKLPGKLFAKIFFCGRR